MSEFLGFLWYICKSVFSSHKGSMVTHILCQILPPVYSLSLFFLSLFYFFNWLNMLSINLYFTIKGNSIVPYHSQNFLHNRLLQLQEHTQKNTYLIKNIITENFVSPYLIKTYWTPVESNQHNQKTQVLFQCSLRGSATCRQYSFISVRK